MGNKKPFEQKIRAADLDFEVAQIHYDDVEFDEDGNATGGCANVIKIGVHNGAGGNAEISGWSMTNDDITRLHHFFATLIGRF